MHGIQNTTLISIVKPMKIQFCFHQQRLNAEKDECQIMEGREKTTTTKYNNEKQQPHNIPNTQCTVYERIYSTFNGNDNHFYDRQFILEIVMGYLYICESFVRSIVCLGIFFPSLSLSLPFAG